jgi:hypothetical protein
MDTVTNQQSTRRGPIGLARVSRGVRVALVGVGVVGLSAHAGDVPECLRVVVADRKPTPGRAVAEKDVLSLDTSMMDIYEGSLAQYKGAMRERVPIILALFSEGGGRMILYRPGHEPLVAPPVPVVYQLTKSVSHSTMAVYQLVVPYLSDPSDKSWHGPMQVFRTRCRTALESLDRLLLFETTEFTTSPEKMLDILGRIVSDRALGQMFFKDYYLMDAELLGGGGRKVIADEAKRRGMKPLLPPAAPFHSNEWPWKTDPKKGKGPSSLEEVK